MLDLIESWSASESKIKKNRQFIIISNTLLN